MLVLRNELAGVGVSQETVKMTEFIYNVLTSSMIKKHGLKLETEEALLSWLVTETRKDYFMELCYMVHKVPVFGQNHDESVIRYIIEMVNNSISHVEQVSKLISLLCLTASYIDFICGNSESVRRRLAEQIALIYTTERSVWLATVSELPKCLKRLFPVCWNYFALKQKWVKLISFHK
ncbi:apoptosis regulator BALF1 [Vespertilionid gammaherpesvirus 1]|uniref:Apoptosis regulator BALF1 n=1 Tax=Vespertilionid gammaherpesvirus 1 TaxID=2560830 RepID=A0A0X9X627_9GAMA|nr:apoptosis regulator BALF1 [Myotis gammaherpesvirus 8]AMA67365.1 apoptosis regulator BALF1 [Vespertilionid gammaherpesvirus 1]